MPTIDAPLAGHPAGHLNNNGVTVHVGTTVHGLLADMTSLTAYTDHGPYGGDLVLVVTGVRPDTTLAEAADAKLGVRGAIAVDRRMHTNLDHV